MKSARLTRVTGIALFTLLAIPLWLAAQEQPASQTNPVPLINQPLFPDAVAPGGAGFVLGVNGTGFVSASVVNWNGTPLATTFVSGSQLTATVPASDIAKASTASVTVVSPRPGGGTSSVLFLPVSPANSFLSWSRSDYPVTSGAWGVAVGDFNSDGKLDLVVSNAQGNTISVLLGKGDGTFQAPVDYTTAPTPFEIAVGDFNRDGKLDLAVGTNGNVVSVLLGIGDGTFQGHVDYPAGGRSPVAADFNGDGNLDLATISSGDNTMRVLLGNGDGTFQPQVTYTTGAFPGWVAAGDFNGDGRLDLAVANFGGATVSVFLGNGDGTFQGKVDYHTGRSPASITTADLNRDGKLDLATGDGSGFVSVLFGNGDGTFRAPVEYVAGANANVVNTGDLNADGQLDLAVSNLDANTVSIFLGNGGGRFQNQTIFTTSNGPRQVAIADFNGDGRLDLATANQNANTVSVLLQNETIMLSPPSLNFGVRQEGTSTKQKVVFTNIGKVAINISSIRISGMRDSTEHNNCGTSLPAGAHCMIGITFRPVRLGPRTAAVRITDDAPGSPQSVPVSGIGATSGANATLSMKSLTFGTQLVGTTSPVQPVTLSNYGTETLDISSIVASGDFGEKDNCGSRLLSGERCTIQVTFKPIEGGNRTGTVSITDNAPNSPQKVHLTGVGTVVKLDPASLDFGNVIVGQKSSPQDTTLTNVGNTRLHVSDITITGTDAGDFSQQNNCPDPGYLGVGKSCTITVTFRPIQVGSRSADVSVSDDGGGSPQQLSLSGTGQPKCGGRCGVRGQCSTGCYCDNITHTCVGGAAADLMKELLFDLNPTLSVACGK